LYKFFRKHADIFVNQVGFFLSTLCDGNTKRNSRQETEEVDFCRMESLREGQKGGRLLRRMRTLPKEA